MNLRQWEYFVAVAEELHFGRAAVRLHMAQPPLSRQIQQLEHALGVSLLVRTNRRVTLTPAGEVFLQQARQVLEQTAQAVQLTQRTHRGEAGHLTMGFVASASYRVLPQILRAFHRQYPNVDLTLTARTSLEQFAMLQGEQMDVGLVRMVGIPGDLPIRVIREEPLAAIIPGGHPLTRCDRINLSDLANLPLILYPRADHPAIYDQIIAYCRAAGFEPRVVQEASETPIVGLVTAGVGIALVIGKDYLLPPNGPMIHLFNDPIPPWRLALAWHRHSSLITNLLNVIARESFE